MIIRLYDTSQLYEVGDEIVFFKKELYKTSNAIHQKLLSGEVVAYDIFGRAMTAEDAAERLLVMVDSPEELATT